MARDHLELGLPRAKVNALMLNFAGFGDHVAPQIDDIYLLDGSGRRLPEWQQGRLVIARNGGPLSIVADAWHQLD